MGHDGPMLSKNIAEGRLSGALGAEIALVAIAAVWGLTFVMVQDAIALIPVMTFLAYRFLAAAIVVTILSARAVKGLAARGWIAGLVMSGFLTAGYITQTLGLARTTASNTGFITGLFVVLTPIFGALLLGQRAGKGAWLAAAVSCVGLFLLSGAGREINLVGDGLVVLTACCFALHILATGRAVGHHDIRALLAVQLGACGLFCLVSASVSGDLAIPVTGTVWSALIVTSLVATALGFFVQTYAQTHASPARTALILASEPAFAGLFAWLLNGETLTPAGWIGAGLITTAIFGVELVPYLRTRRPLPEG
jgi:drug/metabolite transporter (DMT)-like permease